MRIPRAVLVRGEWWDVVEVEGLTYGDDSDEEVEGCCLYDAREIRLEKDAEPADKAATLFHEIVHAACPDLPEHTVAYVEEHLWPVLLENWRLVRRRIGHEP